MHKILKIDVALRYLTRTFNYYYCVKQSIDNMEKQAGAELILMSSSIYQILWSSSIIQYIEVAFHFPKVDVIFNLTIDWGCLPYLKILRLSFNCQNIQAVLNLP